MTPPKTLPFAVWDVFTDTPYTGNPLAIVEQADHLTTAQMQRIAQQFNLSETIFVQTPSDPENTARVRIFLPKAELPFAGHPTIGCALFLSRMRDAGRHVVLEEQAGLVPVHINQNHTQAEFKAPIVPHAARSGMVPTKHALADALGLTPADIGTDHAGLFEGGHGFLYIPVTTRAALTKAAPNGQAWVHALETAAVNTAYVYTQTGPATFSTRMFAPAVGIPEDPATGAAAAVFAAQLIANGHLAQDQSHFTLHQGEDMGRPSHIGLRIETENGALSAVYVSGQACPVATGSITPPQI